ncbi:class I SAM-dependent methyltransferase [Deinococcus sp.]|uniref:class I SAM-dependent methyltransferase n=1 Tax=Deinococcus sp. TaxID=47478 RepID=UPI003C7DF311
MEGVAASRHFEESLNSAALPAGRARTAAQLSNLSALTAAGYMSWRARSLSLLTGTAFPLSREAALFRALCCPQAGEQWLDVGTSGGWYAGVLAAEGARVLACDLSPAMLKVAGRREHHPNIDYALLNAEDTGLPAESFDGVSIGATLNETARPAAMLRESARLLRPGGQLWLMYLARNGGPGQALLSALGGLNFPDPAELTARLPGLERRDLLRTREVVFERWVKASSNSGAADSERK